MFLKPKAKSQKSKVKSGFVFRILLIVYCLLPIVLQAQDTVKRPKIGLVLSGGGAKGFAHIGALKVIDSLGIKIDYIGGTSMGSVIGALYASGYTGKQIDSVFHLVNFDDLMKDYIPRSSKSFYEKRNDELYAITLPFHKMSLGLPIALSKGIYNYNLLNYLLRHVRHQRNFNKLPIPFVCVATDIEKGKEVVFHNGYLPKVILASSAFPSLFSPVEIDGKMLIDGGVVNNYPVEEVRKLGADIIIGVDVQDDLKNRNQLRDATKILVQISNFEMIEKMKEKKQLTDVYIKPDIKDFSVISFDLGTNIIKKGAQASLAKMEDLKKLSSLNQPKKQLKFSDNDSLYINNININTMQNYTSSYIIGKLGFKKHSKIGYTDLKKGINTINATQNFYAIAYDLQKSSLGDDLNLNLSENKNRTFLKFSLHYDGLYKSAALANLTQKRLLFRNDVLSLDLALGDNFRYNLDYYIDNGFYFSFGFKSRLNQFRRNISTNLIDGLSTQQNNLSSINTTYLDFTNQLYLQTIFVQKFLIGTGLEVKYLKIYSKTNNNSASTIFDNSNYASLFGYLKYDSFDSKFFPKKGWFFNADAQTFLLSNNYSNKFNNFSIIKGSAGITRTFFKRFNLNLQTEAGFTAGETSVPFMNFALGGYGFATINNFKHFYGYDFLSISGDSYIKSVGTIDVEFLKKNHINFSANIANVGNKLFSSGNWFSTPKYTGYALGYGLETAIGPIEVKYSWSPELPKGFTWFSVGFWF